MGEEWWGMVLLNVRGEDDEGEEEVEEEEEEEEEEGVLERLEALANSFIFSLSLAFFISFLLISIKQCHAVFVPVA